MAKLTSQQIEAIRSSHKHRQIGGKYPRQKMLPEYSSIYPWVLADDLDPYFVFCVFCECRLSAKRSDLKKHEGSMKHKENASKQNELPTNQTRMEDMESKTENQHYTDGDEIYIKQEPFVEMVENSAIMLHFDSETDSENLDDGDSDDENHACKQSSSCAFPKMRKWSENSQSQNSCSLPVSLKDTNTITYPTSSIGEVSPKMFSDTIITSNNLSSSLSVPVSANVSALQGTKACQITIKKILAPLPPVPLTQVTSTATITPMPVTSIRITQQPQTLHSQQTQSTSLGKCINNCPISMHSPNQGNVSTIACLSSATSPSTRDSFDLFFDSVCASVKALPPKLATEGKIRVMQLIGELEIRAIDQREQAKPMENATSTTK